MNKLLLLLLCSLGLTSISYAGYLDNLTDDQLCGRVGNLIPPAQIAVEVNMRGIYCDGGVAIKTVKTPIIKDSSLTSKLKRWNKMIRGKRPIYTTKTGTNFKVDPFGGEKSIKLNKPF